MGLWNARQIWAALPRDRRQAAAMSLWEDEHLARPNRAVAIAPWLAARGVRAAFFDQLPRARRAAMMAEGGMPDETASQALLSFHLCHRRPLLAMFLDELGIEHDQGLIKEGAHPAPPAKEAVAAAVEKIRTAFDAEDVTLYLRTLTATDPETWEHAGDFAGEPSR